MSSHAPAASHAIRKDVVEASVPRPRGPTMEPRNSAVDAAPEAAAGARTESDDGQVV
jgi:hypothetical protein